MPHMRYTFHPYYQIKKFALRGPTQIVFWPRAVLFTEKGPLKKIFSFERAETRKKDRSKI